MTKILTTENFNGKLANLSADLQTEINSFLNKLETLEESELLESLSSNNDTSGTVMELKIKGVKIYYSLAKNQEGKIDVNFVDLV